MRCLAVSAVCLTLIAVVSSAHAQQANATPEQVDGAIKKAIGYLYSQQANGNWEVVPQRNMRAPQWDVQGNQWGGLTAVATCALLAAGESPQDARIKSAVDFLLKAEISGIYAMGFRCQVWAMLPPDPRVKQAAARDKQVLLAAVRGTPADGRGFYDYAYAPKEKFGGEPNWWDHSVSQYGVLGMWACTQVGIEVPSAYWQVTEQAWKAHQYEDGGWSYRFHDPRPDRTKETISMTAAGLATLFITQEMLHTTDTLECRGNYKDANIERAMKWMGANFWSLKENQPYYSLYGCERVGVAGGYKYIGNVNWFQAGANYIVGNQRQDGSLGQPHNENNTKCIPDTCFGLMFLSRGRAPIMMEKLQYTLAQAAQEKEAKPASWNQRPRDVANVTRWVGKQIERDLNWQIVNLDAPVEELQDAPILYISGKEALNFKAEDLAKLRRFIAYGGLVVGNADCSNKVFADSFVQLGNKLFPDYKFRELPMDHILYTGEQFKRSGWKTPPKVEGLSNGCRELMVLLPNDPARAWQARSFAGAEREVLAQLMADIFIYTSRGHVGFKGETHIVKADPKTSADKKVQVARLEYNGNWDPEPAGWQRLSAILHNQEKLNLSIEAVQLGDGRLLAGGFALAHLTGTGKLELAGPQRDELKKFVESGGTLVVDAAGGSEEFAASSEKVLEEMFSGAKLAQLPPDHPAYKIGKPIAAFEYRPYQRKVRGAAHGPRIKGLDVAGRTAVFFSPDDLSVGLVGNSVDGIAGYEPGTATEIMGHLVQFAMKK
jgi:hypothetical protein